MGEWWGRRMCVGMRSTSWGRFEGYADRLMDRDGNEVAGNLSTYVGGGGGCYKVRRQVDR